MKHLFSILVSISIILLTISCGSDEDTTTDPNGGFIDGVFIANEGPFGSGTGTISFIDNAKNEISNEVYSQANNGSVLGNIVNDIEVNGDKVVIVVNNANKVIIADKSSMNTLHVIEGIALPRFATFISDTECMVSYWGDDGMSGGVVKINVENGTILEDIPLRSGPERMLFKNDQLYVTISGGFGQDSILHIMNPDAGTIVETLMVGDNPIDLVSGMGSSVWVLGRGFTDFNNPANNIPGKLLRINAQNEIQESFDIPAGSSNVEIDLSNNQLYFVNGFVGLVRVDSMLDDLLLMTPITIDGSSISPYSLHYDNETDILYATDALDFQSNGIIHFLANGDTFVQSYTVGIIPTAIEPIN